MADANKTDAEKLDKILSHLDSNSTRMDAIEKSIKADSAKVDAVCAKMDASDKEKADAAKADAERKEKEKMDAAAADAAKADADAKEKADADAKAKKDSDDAMAADAAKKADASNDTKELHAKIDALSRLIPAQVTAEVRARMVGYQSKAERVAQAFGDSEGAPVFVQGESETAYRVRLLSKYQPHSKSYKDADLSKVGDESVFATIENSIYADALGVASNPTVAAGMIIAQKHKDAAGREITKYIGDPNACWDQFNPPMRHVRRISAATTRLQ